MKICIVAYKFGTEQEIGEHLGTYHYFIEIARRLVKAGHQVDVISPWISFFKKGSQEFDGIRIWRYWPPFLNKIWLFPLNRIVRRLYLKSTQAELVNFQNKQQPDVFLVWQARETAYAVSQIKDKLKAPFLFRQITTWQWHFQRSVSEIFGKRPAYKILKFLKLNSVIDIILEFLLDRKSQKKYARAIYEKADKVIFVSQMAAKEGIDLGLSQGKTEVLPVCIETDLFKPLGKKEELRKELSISGSKVVLFIGRINFAEKGIGYLIEAMPEVLTKIKDATLVVVGGGGESQRLEELIDKLGIKEKVLLAGKKPFTELMKYINTADVFVMPSVWQETFGQVAIEAMSCGVPIITFDAGAALEINLSEKTGLIVPAKNVAKLAEAIVKLLENDELRESYGQAARERVLANYTYEVVVAKLLEIINQAKNGKSIQN